MFKEDHLRKPEIALLAFLFKIGDSRRSVVRFELTIQAIINDPKNSENLKKALSTIHYYPEFILQPEFLHFLRFLIQVSYDPELNDIASNLLPQAYAANCLYVELKDRGHSYREIVEIIYTELSNGAQIKDIIGNGNYIS